MKRITLIFLAIFFTSCALEKPDTDKLPVWSTTLEAPIIQTTIELNKFLEDSLISTFPVGEGED